jgi:hypothetical protein
MAVNGRVQILDEIDPGPRKTWRLCFQRVRYVYDDGNLQEGFRFIWRRDDDSLQGARGQARIPSLRAARLLMAEAEKAGWGHYDAEDGDFFVVPSAAA